MSFTFGGTLATKAPKVARPAKPAKAAAAGAFDFHAMSQQQQQQSNFGGYPAPSGGGLFGGLGGGGMFGGSGFEANTGGGWGGGGYSVGTGGGWGGGGFQGEVAFPGDEGMGKRMITVEVTGMQSATVRAGKVTITNPKGLEAEGIALLDAYHERQARTHNDGALMHTTVSGRLVDALTGALVLEVFPFLVRTCLEQRTSILDDWIGAVRDELASGVHPAPCALYARRVSKCVDTAAPMSGADVFSAAKALLGAASNNVTSSISPSPVLQWILHIQVTVVETVKIKKEVPAPVQESAQDVQEEMGGPGLANGMTFAQYMAQNVDQSGLVLQSNAYIAAPTHGGVFGGGGVPGFLAGGTAQHGGFGFGNASPGFTFGSSAGGGLSPYIGGGGGFGAATSIGGFGQPAISDNTGFSFGGIPQIPREDVAGGAPATGSFDFSQPPQPPLGFFGSTGATGFGGPPSGGPAFGGNGNASYYSGYI